MDSASSCIAGNCDFNCNFYTSYYTFIPSTSDKPPILSYTCTTLCDTVMLHHHSLVSLPGDDDWQSCKLSVPYILQSSTFLQAIRVIVENVVITLIGLYCRVNSNRTNTSVKACMLEILEQNLLSRRWKD